MARKRTTTRQIIIGVLIALDRLGLESSKGIAKIIGCDSRTIRKNIQQFHEYFGLVDVRNISTGKKQMEIYKISNVFQPIWDEVKQREPIREIEENLLEKRVK